MKQYLFYNILISILYSITPFYIIAIDFILALILIIIIIGGLNYLLTITYKSTKRVLLIPRREK